MEATSTLADNLLDDLDDLDDIDDEEEDQQQEQDQSGEATTDDGSSLNRAAADNDEKELSRSTNNSNTIPLLQKPRFLDNTTLQNHLRRVEQLSSDNNKSNKKLSDEEEYKMIVQSNHLLAQLNDELARVHGALCETYGPKFPELQELLPGILAYKTAVQVIQNESDLTMVNDQLNAHSCFNSNQIITMTVAASTTAGRPLTEAELSLANQLTSYMDEIGVVQNTLVSFVEEHISHLAPSTCALIGPQLTAKLLGLAGGLQELAQIPACNIQTLGNIKQKDRAGFSAKQQQGPGGRQIPQQPHQGILVECDMLTSQVLAPTVRNKLFKQIAAKVALCARVDAVNAQQGRARAAAPGEKFRHDLLQKLQKWQEPDQAPVQKALPKPDLTVKKRRGGKRMRAAKARFEETALMKQANTRAFSSQAGEYGDDAMGLTLGLLDTTADGAGDGNIRKNVGERKKMKMVNTKASRKAQAKAAALASQHQAAAAMSSTSGMASTVAFTPLQAMELVNPDAQKERIRQANQKWFADSAGFQSALPKKK